MNLRIQTDLLRRFCGKIFVRVKHQMRMDNLVSKF